MQAHSRVGGRGQLICALITTSLGLAVSERTGSLHVRYHDPARCPDTDHHPARRTIELRCPAGRNPSTTADFIARQPGFVSANLHRTADSTRLVNYGQWESRELYDQARARPEFQAFSARVNELADRVDPVACEVVFTKEARHSPGGGRRRVRRDCPKDAET
ncbi:antibiotic biosynthesis monooxygenase family protein [Nocardia wallacei]|uniref:antibiotic biosynthesis monooxygenase family protein n=1 Tax=Nocardia wallacei TaxID=480035 RepID=UPI002453CD7A|nr:antibiotic biosynthesis monooxygenase [Nocardia wallacei]